jgi:hypothetical protein
MNIDSVTGDFAAEAYPRHYAWQLKGGPDPAQST